MQYWNEIIHTAMLGTDKKSIDAQVLPASISDVMASGSFADAEEAFLQTAALAFNFRQCSTTAIQASSVNINSSAAEQLPYCSSKTMAVLSDILNVDSSSLLRMWLQACNNTRQIVQPDVIPQLLNIAIKQKELRTLIVSCCGNRGKWLSQFNAAWKFGGTSTPEEAWQTGTLQQRVQVLAQLRKEAPAKALEWLQQTWPQEDAATKTALLDVLQENSSTADFSFLESAAIEKSKKVKEAATNVLKLIPESPIVQAFWQVLKQSIYLTKEKALLGLTTKTKLVVQLPEQIDESIYKWGIDKLSKNAKEISDEHYILQQLVSAVPPHWWEAHFGENREGVFEWFKKEDTANFLIPALGNAAIHFKDKAWLQTIVKSSASQDIQAASMPLVSDKEREMIAARLLARGGNDAYQAVEGMLTAETEWSLEITRKLFAYIMNDAWRYNNAFFSQNIHLVPAAIASELDGLKPANQWQESYWSNTTQFISRLLYIKQQIQSSFK